MAPNNDVVDLTGFSDEDNPSNDNTATGPGRQTASKRGSKSSVKYVTDDASSRPRKSGINRIDDQDSSPSRQIMRNPRNLLNGSSTATPRREPHASQRSQNRKDWGIEGGPSGSFSSSKEGSQKRVPGRGDSADELALPVPHETVTPRGYDLNSSQQLVEAVRRPGSALGGTASGRPKRPLDRDIMPDDDSLPRKKQKLDSHTNGYISKSSRKKQSRDVSEKTSDPIGGVVRGRLSQKPKGPPGRSDEPIDLVSPPREAQKVRLSAQQEKGCADPAEDQTSSTVQTPKDKAESLVRTTKRRTDRLLSTDPDSVSRDFISSQPTPSKMSSPNRSTDFSESGPLTLRKKSAPPSQEVNHSRDIPRTPEAQSVRPSNRDSTPRVRKETAKAQALSADKKSKAQSETGGQNSARKDRRRKSSTPEQPAISSFAKQKVQEVQQNNNSDDDDDGGISNDAVLQRASAEKASLVAIDPAKTVRRDASENDTSYQSMKLRDRGRDESEKGISADKRRIVEFASPSRKADAPLSREKTGSLNADAQAIPRVDNSRLRETDDGSEVSTPVVRETPRNTHNSYESPKEGALRRPSVERSTPKVSSSRGSFGHDDHHKDQDPILEQPVSGSTRRRTPKRIGTTVADEADTQVRSEAMKHTESNEITADREISFARPVSVASAVKPQSVYSDMPLVNKVEKVLGKYLGELREDNEYWTSILMSRARLSKERPEDSGPLAALESHSEERTSFANFKALKLSPYQKSNSVAKPDQALGVEKMTSGTKSSGVQLLSAPYTTFASDTPNVPNYTHYVSIKNNILAPNVTNLHCWPYFGDNHNMDAQNLADQYNLDIAPRERKLLLLLKAQKYEEYVDGALQDLECSWSDVLRFLLEPSPDVGSDKGAMDARKNRHHACEEDFSRTSEKWQTILSSLPPSDPDRLARVAVLCENFQKLAKFSLWHIARRSHFAQLPEKGNVSRTAQPSDNALTCRVCLRFNCPYHGELNEHPEGESDAESGSAADSVVDTDVVDPRRVNYRRRVAFPPPLSTTSPLKGDTASNSAKKDPRYWRTFHNLPGERGPFYPCHHPGSSCEDEKCSCFENRLPCEKFCGCSTDCPQKFQGCACSTAKFRKGQRGGCFEDDRCACFQTGRECDPDLCGSCGVCEVVDAVNKYSDSILVGRCRNCSIQRAVPKQTLLGDSGVHGLGLYACENIKEHDFVGEYKGEIIMREEAERRGAVYEHQRLSYQFSLNATQDIDSTYFGNKVRFINHASGSKANLYPRIIMVNTVHRIALYASCAIRLGQELLFDYGPKFPDASLGGKKSKKSAPHVRNINLVRGFLDVEESEDALGNLRAKGVAYTSNARNKQKGRKPKPGTRPGAGRKPRLSKRSDEVFSAGMHTDQDAGDRLLSFNISDEVRSDVFDDVDVDADQEDDEAFEPDNLVSDDSEASEASERSEFESENHQDAEDLGIGGSKLSRGAIATRRSRR